FPGRRQDLRGLWRTPGQGVDRVQAHEAARRRRDPRSSLHARSVRRPPRLGFARRGLDDRLEVAARDDPRELFADRTLGIAREAGAQAGANEVSIACIVEAAAEAAPRPGLIRRVGPAYLVLSLLLVALGVVQAVREPWISDFWEHAAVVRELEARPFA